MLALFATTLFVSASLLFLVQPLFAKMLLPLLGGTPAAWNTCVVFFEVALVFGYLYSHLALKWLGVRKQVALHMLVLLVPLVALPIHIGEGWALPSAGNPIGWVFLVLLVSVGLPFFAVSTSAPLLQRWLGATTHPAARDPYFLYAASNVGSLLALVSYPTLVEPSLRLTTQSRLWAGAYVVFVALTAACAWVTLRSSRGEPVSAEPRDEASILASGSASQPAVSWIKRLRWLALSAVPSSLMLSTTTYITTDIAAVPLLWVIPLAVYLVTFILVFARRQVLPLRMMSAILPLAIIPTVIIFVSEDSAGLTTIPVLIVALFIAAMVCHGELVRTRPPAAHLTDFYLSMSIGGALGGLFNTLIAPLAFTTAAEYPIGIVLACLLRPAPAVFGTAVRPSSRRDRWLDLAFPLMLGVLVVALKASGQWTRVDEDTYWGLAHVYALPLAIWLTFWSRPLRLGLGLAAVLAFSSAYASKDSRVLLAERSFFGIYQVAEGARTILLTNGTTVHGRQLRDPKNRCLPLTYYHPSGPAGQLFASFTGAHAKSNIAIVGLGAGSMAGYTRPNEQWTFYEIDPAIERIARDERYFTYLKACGENYRIVMGDARVSLKAAPDAAHDVIVLDAFSSDAVPVHLLTREAVELYFRKLGPNGVLALHISNRFLDLEPVVGALARDLGLAALIESDDSVSRAEELESKLRSQWVVVARTSQDFGDLVSDPRWKPPTTRPAVRAWTDDFSNIIRVIRWKDE